MARSSYIEAFKADLDDSYYIRLYIDASPFWRKQLLSYCARYNKKALGETLSTLTSETISIYKLLS